MGNGRRWLSNTYVRMLAIGRPMGTVSASGSHRHAVRMARHDWEHTARVRFGRIATTFDPLAAALTEWTWY